MMLASGYAVRLSQASSSKNKHKEKEAADLDVLVDAKVSDARAAFSASLRARRRLHASLIATFAAALATDMGRLREYRFLRSSFCPFPLEFRRQKMRELASSAVRGNETQEALVLERVVDHLLLGEDVLQGAEAVIHVATRADAGHGYQAVTPELHPHHKKRRYLEIRDLDLAQGFLEASVARVLRAKAGRMGLLDQDLDKLAGTAPRSVTQLNNRALLRELRGSMQPGNDSCQAIRAFVLHSRRSPWMVMGNVDPFAALALHARIRNVGMEVSAKGVQRMLAFSLPKDQSRRIMSERFVPSLQDFSRLLRDLGLSAIVIACPQQQQKQQQEQQQEKKQQEKQQQQPKVQPKSDPDQVVVHELPEPLAPSVARVPVFFFRPRHGIDMLVNLSPRHLLTFSTVAEVPAVLRTLRASTRPKRRSASASTSARV